MSYEAFEKAIVLGHKVELEDGKIIKKQKKLKKVLPKYIHCVIFKWLTYGAVAQLARASGSYPAGRVFESHRRYQ